MMTETDIREKIEGEFSRWNALAQGDCQDPIWPDGVNMNIVRNHIIYWYKILKECGIAQTNLFGEIVYKRAVPPEVPFNYMVWGGAHSNRLDWKGESIVWGRKRQYHA